MDWSEAFDQFSIACELYMINAISSSNVCLVTMKPLAREMATCFASVSEDRSQPSYFQIYTFLKYIYKTETVIELHMYMIS